MGYHQLSASEINAQHAWAIYDRWGRGTRLVILWNINSFVKMKYMLSMPELSEWDSCYLVNAICGVSVTSLGALGKKSRGA